MAREYQDTETDGAPHELAKTKDLDVIRMDDKIFVVVGSETHLSVYEIDNDPSSPTYGELSDAPIDTVSNADDPSTNLDDVESVESLEIAGTTYVFAAGLNSGGISSFSLSDTGTLTSVDNVDDGVGGANNLSNIYEIATIQVDDGAGGVNSYIFGAGDDGGISTFQVDDSGNMTHVEDVDDDASVLLKNVHGMDTIHVDDGAGGENSYLVAASRGEDGLSVFEVATDGTLTHQSNFTDDGSTYLATAKAVEAYTIDGQAYVFAGGEEDGVSVFELDNTGTLSNVGNLGDDASLNLNNVQDLAVSEEGGEHYLWVGAADAGLDVYRIDIDGATGAVTLTRTDEFDSGTYDTGDVEGLDAESGYIATSNPTSHSISSFTAPCFAPGTRILTPGGERPVEDLAVGDLVLTADRGPQPIRWIGIRRLVFGTPEVDTQKPIEIKAGALGPGCPRRTLVVSPQHQMFFSGDTVSRLFGAPEVIGLAKGLVHRPQIRRMNGKAEITYHALLFDGHEIIFAEGAPNASFRPGPFIMSLFSPAQRAEIHAIYPGLRDDPETGLGPPARRILKRREVEALVEAEPGALVARPGAARSRTANTDLPAEIADAALTGRFAAPDRPSGRHRHGSLALSP